MFFYKSPSTNIRDRVFIPLRKICAASIAKPKEILLFFNDIVTIIEILARS